MSAAIVRAIRKSALTIYDLLQDRPELFLDNETIGAILDKALRGLLLNQPLRTRSKVFKSAVCEALGYPVPSSFRKTKPRFPGQNFDTYVQKANNLQIWNEQVSSSRRYVLIRVNERHKVTKVRVVTGNVIAAFDTTGTLTHKYQAKSKEPVIKSILVTDTDTKNVMRHLISTRIPEWKRFLPIKDLFNMLLELVGTTVVNPGTDQERNRGSSLHEAVCKCLGHLVWDDNGQFPDVKEQLLEVKLQTASTIDLGLACPDSVEPIADLPTFQDRDVRYAIYYGSLTNSGVRLDHLVLSSGAAFFNFFRRFGGLITNKKLQIPLPADFFG